MAINSSGQIVGYFGDNTGTHGFLFSDGAYAILNGPNSRETFLSDINNSGQVVGDYVEPGAAYRQDGYLVSGGVVTTVAPPGSTYTEIAGINDNGQVVGDFDDAAGLSHGFLYSGGVFTIFDPPNSTATFANGINASGQVAGTFKTGVADYHGFLYTPPVNNMYQYPAGISMVSVPYDYSKQGTDAAVLFGLSGSAAPAPIAIYDPVKNAYDFYPTLLDGGKQTRPGRAYWVSETAAQPSPSPGDPVASPFTESLSPGWNMIAAPFPIALGTSTLQFTAGVPVGSAAAETRMLEPDAVTAGLIGGPLWAFDTSSNEYQQATTLEPYSGCWIYIDPTVSGGHPVTLTFTQPGT